MTSNTTATAASAPDPQDIGAQIAAEMLAAFKSLANSGYTHSRKEASQDPWNGINTLAWSVKERNAVNRMGWNNWSVTRVGAGLSHPVKGTKDGPKMPDPQKVARGQYSPEGFTAWHAMAMISARLHVYGKISVQHCAVILNTLGVNPADHGNLATTSQFALKLQAMLGGRVTKTADGFYEATPRAAQPLHDQLARAADLILKPEKVTSQPTRVKPATQPAT